MENSNPNINASAKLFLDYHNKKLSDKEMHQLEKEALGDAFLDDALVGYGFDENAIKNLEKISLAIRKRNKDKNKGFWYNIRPFYPHMAVAATIFVLAFSAYFVLVRSIKEDNLAVSKDEVSKPDNAIQLSENNKDAVNPVVKKTENNSLVDTTQFSNSNGFEKKNKTISFENPKPADVVKMVSTESETNNQSGNSDSQKESESPIRSLSVTEDVRMAEPTVVQKNENVAPIAQASTLSAYDHDDVQETQVTAVESTKRKSVKATTALSKQKSPDASPLQLYMKSNPFVCYDANNVMQHGEVSISYKTDEQGNAVKIRIEKLTHDYCSESVKDYLKKIPVLEKNLSSRKTITIRY